MTDKNGELPKGWKSVKLGDLSINGIINGIFKHRHEFGSGIPIVNVYDLYQGMAVDLSKVERVEVSDQDFQRYQIISGDLLFCRSSLKK